MATKQYGAVPSFAKDIATVSFVTTDSQTLVNKTLTAPVINSPTGIAKADVGLSNVDNTSDAAKNGATATLTNKTIGADQLVDGTTNKAYTATEKTKLAGIATSATANSSDATLEARANHTGTQTASTISDFSAAADARITTAGLQATSAKGAVNGYASLDGSALVPASQLPSYVDDVLEYANLAACPGTGETGKIYVTLDTNKTYRWSGSTYVEISASPGSTDAVTEGSVNKYYTDTRADARVALAVGVSVQAYDSDLTAFAAKTAPSGAVVGDTDSQTLTNKTLSGSSNTLSNIAVSSLIITGTPDGTKYLRDDGSWQTVASGSGITRSVVTVSSSVTLGATASTDYVALIASSGTATLPTAVSNTNRYTLKNTDSVVSTTILTTSGQTIDGSSSAAVNAYGSLDLISDGTNWRIL